MPVRGARVVAGNLRQYGGGFLKHVNKTMKAVHVVLKTEARKNLSSTKLSVEDLKRYDHPYATRHGARGKEHLIHPYHEVHKRSGELLASEKSGTKDASITGGRLDAMAYYGLDEGRAEHAKHVIYGTSKMIPRPVLRISRDNVAKPMYELLKKNLKDFTFSFHGVNR